MFVFALTLARICVYIYLCVWVCLCIEDLFVFMFVFDCLLLSLVKKSPVCLPACLSAQVHNPFLSPPPGRFLTPGTFMNNSAMNIDL